MTIRDTAAVTCGSPVNGSKRRKPRREFRPRSSRVEVMRVQAAVLRAARRACRPGEHMVFVSPTRVDIVYDTP